MSLGMRQSSGLTADSPDDFSVDRMRWIIRLRWIALVGILGAAGVSALGLYPGVAWEVLLGTGICAGIYNLVLWRRHRRAATRGSAEAVRQAIGDMALLTIVLWAAGGMRTPFIGYYVFHVAIVGILGGKRATVTAALAALIGSGLLLVTEHVPALQIARWDPAWPLDLVAEVVAFLTTIGAVAYLVTHAVEELRRGEAMLAAARASEALELQLLTHTLDELDAGLEVVEGGSVLWRNRRAEQLAPSVPVDDGSWHCPGDARACEKHVSGKCPVRPAVARGESGHCRFAANIDGVERVYEMNVYPLATGPEGEPREMNLYVDRSESLIAERQLILAERLASLGRVTQGVAHELNTPLATIRTLSADMLAALKADSGDRASLVDDLLESAALVHDETRRLGKITQGLLTGRDLTSSEVQGPVPLAAVIERARALVFAGADGNIPVEVADLTRHPVIADRDHLVQVMVNLLQNAYDAVKEAGGGSVRVHAKRSRDQVEIMIDDDGPGVPESISSRLFEPFATSKPPGKGTGLGLYTSYMLVRSMQGTLTLEGREEGGSRATVSLPMAGVERLPMHSDAEAAQ